MNRGHGAAKNVAVELSGERQVLFQLTKWWTEEELPKPIYV